MKEVHPFVLIIKKKLIAGEHTYKRVASSTGIPINRLKNLMSGRVDMSLGETDILCSYLKVSPIEMLLGRDDMMDRPDFLDLRCLPDNMRNILYLLHKEMLSGGLNACKC